jgi:hypothetical protein
MTTRRFARQLADWGVNVDAVAAMEDVAKIFNTKVSMFGEIDPDESIDFRRLPQPDEPT